MIRLGTLEQIEAQTLNVASHEDELMAAKMRLRALMGMPLLQVGESMASAAVLKTLIELSQEFGGDNLRVM